jgi:hypothetical protein
MKKSGPLLEPAAAPTRESRIRELGRLRATIPWEEIDQPRTNRTKIKNDTLLSIRELLEMSLTSSCLLPPSLLFERKALCRGLTTTTTHRTAHVITAVTTTAFIHTEAIQHTARVELDFSLHLLCLEDET